VAALNLEGIQLKVKWDEEVMGPKPKTPAVYSGDGNRKKDAPAGGADAAPPQGGAQGAKN
jgi:hypothetical protein